MADIGAPLALVTGGKRGSGLEVCRQPAQRGMIVWLGACDEAKGAAAASFFATAGPLPGEQRDRAATIRLLNHKW